MDEKRDRLVLDGLLGQGISGWLNNITDKEKRESVDFLEGSSQLEPLVFAPDKIINCAILISRVSRLVEKYGVTAIEIINELLWGFLEDGRNTPIDFNRAVGLTQFLKMKGGK